MAIARGFGLPHGSSIEQTTRSMLRSTFCFLTEAITQVLLSGVLRPRVPYLFALENADKESDELRGVVSRLQGILENIENYARDGDTNVLEMIRCHLEKIRSLLKGLGEDATKANCHCSDAQHKLMWLFKADRIKETFSALERGGQTSSEYFKLLGCKLLSLTFLLLDHKYHTYLLLNIEVASRQ
ncbi:MAG: hypothetical protein M1840_004280 [Geoglossum simile]|nr:MAG: hypothetical protein M1840_004280 [Geoglossum simile]